MTTMKKLLVATALAAMPITTPIRADIDPIYALKCAGATLLAGFGVYKAYKCVTTPNDKKIYHNARSNYKQAQQNLSEIRHSYRNIDLTGDQQKALHPEIEIQRFVDSFAIYHESYLDYKDNKVNPHLRTLTRTLDTLKQHKKNIVKRIHAIKHDADLYRNPELNDFLRGYTKLKKKMSRLIYRTEYAVAMLQGLKQAIKSTPLYQLEKNSQRLDTLQNEYQRVKKSYNAVNNSYSREFSFYASITIASELGHYLQCWISPESYNPYLCPYINYVTAIDNDIRTLEGNQRSIKNMKSRIDRYMSKIRNNRLLARQNKQAYKDAFVYLRKKLSKLDKKIERDVGAMRKIRYAVTALSFYRAETRRQEQRYYRNTMAGKIKKEEQRTYIDNSTIVNNTTNVEVINSPYAQIIVETEQTAPVRSGIADYEVNVTTEWAFDPNNIFV